MHPEQYLESLIAERGFAVASIKAYKKDLLDYFIYLKENNLEFHNASYDQVNRFISFLSKNGISSRAIVGKISALKGYYNFLLNEKIINENPILFIAKPKFTNKLLNYLSDQEFTVLANFIC